MKELVNITDDSVGNVRIQHHTVQSPGSLLLALLPSVSPSVNLVDIGEITVFLLSKVYGICNQTFEASCVLAKNADNQSLLLIWLPFPAC